VASTPPTVFAGEVNTSRPHSSDGWGGRRSASPADEARRIAANIAKLPELLATPSEQRPSLNRSYSTNKE